VPAERSQQIEQLYHAARERNPDERAAFLEQACSGDDALRREVESLLAEDSRVQSFLEAPAAELMQTMSREGPGQRLRGAEPPETDADVTATGTSMTQLGPYKIDARIGQGGMGEVFRAHDTRLRRTVAIKVLPRDKMADPERRRRFLQEARAASALNHPNIVTLYDIASESGIDYLVMEYVPGQSLEKRIAGGLPMAEVLGYSTQIASALAAAHSAGIIHRDIKPSNVIVTPESQVKILDFGLAKLEEPAPGLESKMRAAEQTLTETGVVLGTLDYMSPEQARAEGVDARTDLFSFGAVLYEMATGRRAFPRALDWTTPPMERLEPELGRIVLKLLQVDRELRYQTAADVAADLKRFQRGAEGRPPSRRWRVAVAALVTLAIAVAAVLYLRPHIPASREQWVQLTNFPDSVSQPALSPDGRMLTFIRGPSTFFTPGEIFIKMLPDGAPVQLTRDNISKMSPVFSPDGSRVAYAVRSIEGKPWDTWLVPVLSGDPRPWLANASRLVWINQNNVLFSEHRKFPHLAIVAAEESRARERDVYVPEHDHGMAHRSYSSPDGKWALVVEMEPNGNWVPCRLLPMDGSSTGHRVGPPDAECTFAAWSPDGKWIYLSSKAGGTFHTWRQH
jgi:serine/threonine protein kinase